MGHWVSHDLLLCFESVSWLKLLTATEPDADEVVKFIVFAMPEIHRSPYWRLLSNVQRCPPPISMLKSMLVLISLLVPCLLRASSAEGGPWPPPWQIYDVKMPETKDSGYWSPTTISEMKLLPDGKKVVAAMRDHTVAIIDVANGKIVSQSEPLDYEIEGMAVAPEKDRIIVGGGRRLVFLGLSDFKQKAEIPLKGRIFQLSLSPDQEKVAVAQATNEAVAVTVSDSPKVIAWPIPSFGYAVGWLPDNRHCVVRTRTTTIYDTNSGRSAGVLSGDIVNADKKYGLSADGKWFISYTDNLNVYRGDLVLWDAAEILAHLQDETAAACYLSVPGPCFAPLFLGIPLEKLDFAGVKGFDPRTPRTLPIITGDAQPDTAAVALSDGKILFAKSNGHLYCWDGTKVQPGTRWSDAVPPGRKTTNKRPVAPGQGTSKKAVNYGESFRFGELDCLGFFTPPNEESQKLEGLLQIVDAKSPAKVIHSIPLPPVSGNVEIVSSPDGQLLAVSTGMPGQTFTVPLDEVRKNPALMRTAVKPTPSLRIINAKTGEVFTNQVWESQGASRMQFDPSGTHLLCTSMTRDGIENQLLYNLKSRRVEANGPVPSHPDRATLLLPDSRIVIGDSQHLAIYKPSGGQWIKEVERTDLNSSKKKLTASPDGTQFILYNPQNCGRFLSTKNLEDLGWIFPTLLLSRISGYDVTWPEPNRLIARNGEKFEEFLIPRDMTTRVFPNVGGRLRISDDGKLLSAQNGDKILVLDYHTGKEVPMPTGAHFQRSWRSPRPPVLTSGGYNHIVIEDFAPPGKKRIAVWLASIGEESWLQIPKKNLVAYSRDGLWLVEIPSGRVVWHWNAPQITSLAYNAQGKELVGSTSDTIQKWKLPDEELGRKKLE